jgi:hypothetical protein
MFSKMAGGFILILVAAYLTLVGADDLQEINCKGKRNKSFHYHNVICWILNKESANPLLVYVDVLFILNKSLNEFLNIQLNDWNIMNSCL